MRIEVVSRRSYWLFGSVVKVKILDVLKGEFDYSEEHMSLWEPYIHGDGLSGDCGWMYDLGDAGDDRAITLGGKSWTGLMRGKLFWALDKWVADEFREGKYKEMNTIEDYKQTCISIGGKWDAYPPTPSYMRAPLDEACFLPCPDKKQNAALKSIANKKAMYSSLVEANERFNPEAPALGDLGPVLDKAYSLELSKGSRYNNKFAYYHKCEGDFEKIRP